MKFTTVLRDNTRPWLARLDAIPERDRYAMLAAGLALVGALELMAVQPMRDKREAIQLAATTEAQGVSEAAAASEADQATQAADVTARLAKVDAELAALGVGAGAGAGSGAGVGVGVGVGGRGARGESLSFLLSRTLQRQAVNVVSLRALGVQELNLAVPADAAGTGVTGTVISDAAAASKAMYRHRYELTLGGEIAQLTASVAALEHGLLPLRIERVRLASTGSDNAVQATVTLVTIGLERTWLSL